MQLFILSVAYNRLLIAGKTLAIGRYVFIEREVRCFRSEKCEHQ
jgi:hypothetical protein